MDNQIKSRGKIQNLKRLQQSAEFDNIRFTNGKYIMPPTDVDMLFDYQRKLNIINDFKLGDKGLEYGQQITFTNVVDLLQAGGEALGEPDYGAYFITTRHNTPIDEPLFDADICEVTRVYYKGEWTTPSSPITLLEWMKYTFKKHGLDLEHYIEKKVDYMEMLRNL
jgi:hypothetical protein